MLYDNHGRPINYLRLAVTDRCNLRCFYCMPENGIKYVLRKDLLSFEEMERMMRVFSALGINKLRITGGEPFVRKGIMGFLEKMVALPQLDDLHITTNGTFTEDKVETLEQLGVRSINLSLDSLDRDRFLAITRRDQFEQVMRTYYRLLESSIQVKINMVVMEGRNIDDILPMLALSRDAPVSVRFIEEMPFNGTPGQGNATFWSMRKILEYIQQYHPDLEKLEDPPHATARHYRLPGHRGDFGIIAAFTRSFCGSCNRIRVTPQGDLRTCLYGPAKLQLRDLMRNGASDEELADALRLVLAQRARDGFAAEAERKQEPVSESMATIGG